MRKIIHLQQKDNVATAVKDIKAGETISYRDSEGKELSVQVREDITLGFKIALTDIAEHQSVMKYGEIIGVATCPISKGSMVHLNNLQSTRGKSELVKKGDK